MKKFLKFLLWLFFLCVFLIILAGVGYWVIIVKKWPWWIFAVIAGSIAGLIVGVFAIKKFLVRRNEKKFIQRVIKEEEAAVQNAPEEEKYKLKDMQTQWKQSIDKLRKSLLRKKGNPLYVLPWYMLMGESGTGKTSAIKNSNLSSPLTDVSQAATISGTKNCDWWFFDQAIILDTAGRYTIPIDESTDKKEWQAFLTLLAKYRKKEPINGVIVGVSSDTLLGDDDITLSEKAKNIRQRINQLMRILGARFPVYLLVTKMDLVNGFTDFCDYVPEQRETQVMGYSNDSEEPDCIKVLNRCMSGIFDELKKLRRIFVQNRLNNFAIVFPSEFMRLKPGLEAYVGSLFGEDIYQATPLFRGIYFSSACRQGTPKSEFLEKTGIKYTGANRSDKNKGYFLKNLFQAVLPSDRNIFTPISEFLVWRKVTISLGIFSLIMICSALCGVLTFSYYNNVKAIHSYDTAAFTEKPVVSNAMNNILRFDRQRFELEKLEKSNAGWILPRMGLNRSLVLEKNLKRIFVNDVRKNLVKPFDTLFFEKSGKISSNTPYKEIVDYAVYDIRRINIFKNFGSDEFMSDRDRFEQSIKNIFPELYNGVPPVIAARFSDIYYDFLQWDNNKKHRSEKLEKFQNQLALIADRSGGFHWLVSKSVCNTPDITIGDFFRGYDINQKARGLRVSGAFTKEGRNSIVSFISLLKKAFPDKDKFTIMEDQFWLWYSKEFYNAWYNFIVRFPRGIDWQSVTDNWVDAGALMATENNPYFALLDYMAGQFDSFTRDNGERPSWAQTVILIRHIRKLAKTEKEKEKGSFFAKLALKKDKLSKKLLGSKGTKAYKTLNRKNATQIDFDFELAKQWNKYVASLETLAPATAYNEKCYHMFFDFFSVLKDPSKQDKPFNQVYANLNEFKAFFRQSGISPEIFRLIGGPFDFFKIYGIYNTVIYLQNKWSEVVLSAANSIDPAKYYSILFDRNNGLIWKYVNDYASVFIDQNRMGFFSRKVFGVRLPFSNKFFRLLNKGKSLSLEKQKEYVVTIQDLPLNVNQSSAIKPYSSKLTLECAGNKTELINENFPESKTFKWNPATCGDVTLSIKFKDVTLEKIYSGSMGFAEFLYDFRDGRKIFNVSDFPDHVGYLTNKGVTDIIVSYKINGIEPVLKFWNRNPIEIPSIIFNDFQQKSGLFPIPESKLKPPVKKLSQIEELIRQKRKFKITMESIPMGINKGADIKPLASIFWMNCNGRIIRLENNNYPDSVSFEWDPLRCGKVLLLIQLPKITLLKKYQNFLQFLKDFHYNSRTFTCNDFPKQKEKLLQHNISYIKLTYVFKGKLPFFKVNTVSYGKFKPVGSGLKSVNTLLSPDISDKKGKIIKSGGTCSGRQGVISGKSSAKQSAKNKSDNAAGFKKNLNKANKLSKSSNLNEVKKLNHSGETGKPGKSGKSIDKPDKSKIPPKPGGLNKFGGLHRFGQIDKTNCQEKLHGSGSIGKNGNETLINTKHWILKQNPRYYTIQIMMGHNQREIIGFAKHNRLISSSAIYKSYIKNQVMYNLIYGCHESYNQAEKALTGLSDSAAKYSPFIRRFASIRKEIR